MTLAGKLPELTSVVSVQAALECFAHDWDLNPRIVPALYWSFVHMPAHLLMALVVSLVAFASTLEGRRECQCTSAPLYDIHFRHLGMLRYCCLGVMLLAFVPRAECRRVWQSDEQYLGHHILPPRPVCIMAPLACEGLAGDLLAGRRVQVASPLFRIRPRP
jgi:hypothetical protein